MWIITILKTTEDGRNPFSSLLSVGHRYYGTLEIMYSIGLIEFVYTAIFSYGWFTCFLLYFFSSVILLAFSALLALSKVLVLARRFLGDRLINQEQSMHSFVWFPMKIWRWFQDSSRVQIFGNFNFKSGMNSHTSVYLTSVFQILSNQFSFKLRTVCLIKFLTL